MGVVRVYEWEVGYWVCDENWEMVLETAEIVNARTEGDARSKIHQRWKQKGYKVIVEYAEQVA